MKIIWIKIAISVAVLFSASVANAQIEKWVDENGRTHYGSSSPGDVESKTIKNAPITFSSGTSQVELPPEQGVVASTDQSKLNYENTSSRKTAVLFSTSWCGYCKQARAYMLRYAIPFVELDIEQDRNARAEYDRFKGSGVPLLVVGEKTMRGFNSEGYDRIFK